ncbi:MAG: Rieske (2Fe-2S) protein [Bacillota bacterium]
MSEWVPVSTASDLPPGSWKACTVSSFDVLVFNLDGSIHAVEACCTVNGARLELECDSSGTLRCPHNDVRFDVRTGMPLSSPPFEPLAKFRTRIREGVVEVHRDPWF